MRSRATVIKITVTFFTRLETEFPQTQWIPSEIEEFFSKFSLLSLSPQAAHCLSVSKSVTQVFYTYRRYVLYSTEQLLIQKQVVDVGVKTDFLHIEYFKTKVFRYFLQRNVTNFKRASSSDCPHNLEFSRKCSSIARKSIQISFLAIECSEQSASHHFLLLNT